MPDKKPTKEDLKTKTLDELKALAGDLNIDTTGKHPSKLVEAILKAQTKS